MGLLGWIIVLLVTGGLIWLIFGGPSSFKLIAISLLVGIFLGAFLWETFIDPGPAVFWPETSGREKVVIKEGPESIPGNAVTIPVEHLPSTLSPDVAEEVGSAGGVTVYLYDDPNTPLADLVVETTFEVASVGLNTNGSSSGLTIDEVNLDGGAYYSFSQVQTEGLVGAQVIVVPK